MDAIHTIREIKQKRNQINRHLSKEYMSLNYIRILIETHIKAIKDERLPVVIEEARSIFEKVTRGRYINVKGYDPLPKKKPAGRDIPGKALYDTVPAGPHRGDRSQALDRIERRYGSPEAGSAHQGQRGRNRLPQQEADEDRRVQDSFPAAMTNHHDFVSGLAYHVHYMLRTAEALCDIYPSLNRSLLYSSIILHDIGKVKELSGPVGTTYTVEGNLIGHMRMMMMDKHSLMI